MAPIPFYAAHLRHLCGHNWCKNIAHFAWGTATENSLDRRFHEQHGRGHVAPSEWTPDVCRILGMPSYTRKAEAMPIVTWANIDAELDQVEEGDTDGVVAVFQKFNGMPMAPSQEGDKWTRVSVSSFSRHIGMPRHTFNKLVVMYRHREKETA